MHWDLPSVNEKDISSKNLVHVYDLWDYSGCMSISF